MIQCGYWLNVVSINQRRKWSNVGIGSTFSVLIEDNILNQRAVSIVVKYYSSINIVRINQRIKPAVNA